MSARHHAPAAPLTFPVMAHWRDAASFCRSAGPAVHTHAVLVFYTRGEARVQQRAALRVRAGDVHLVPAGEAHQVLSQVDAGAYGVGFQPPTWGSAAAELMEPFERVRAGGTAVVTIPAARHQHLEQVCAQLVQETTGHAAAAPHAAVVQQGLLTLALAEVARAAGPPPAHPAGPSLVGDALRFVERHCLGPLSLRQVAAAVHRSPAHVATAVRHATGRTVGAWIVAGRMAEARRRLLHTDEHVDTIAERVGYRDPTHFIRVFRREHSMTPAAWRRQGLVDGASAY